jgi:16S rRNA (guanine966-N2)-methyltransferase
MRRSLGWVGDGSVDAMTRIISGFAGSIALAVPPNGTRPTSDRVREAIFSALDARGVIQGARVLDLYAGSGALGLEAASRGARRVTLVERSSGAVPYTRKNAALIRKSAPRSSELTIEVSSSPVHAFLTGAEATWQIVFLDPPYDLSNTELVHALQVLVPRLETEATVVLERSSRMPVPAWPDGLTLDRRKDYGDTSLYWLSPTEPV